MTRGRRTATLAALGLGAAPLADFGSDVVTPDGRLFLAGTGPIDPAITGSIDPATTGSEAAREGP